MKLTASLLRKAACHISPKPNKARNYDRTYCCFALREAIGHKYAGAYDTIIYEFMCILRSMGAIRGCLLDMGRLSKLDEQKVRFDLLNLLACAMEDKML